MADLGHANINKGSTTIGSWTQPIQWEHLKYLAWVIEVAVLLQYPTGHLLYQATLPSLGHIVALPNTQKHTQGGCQNQKTKKYGPNERTEQNSSERTKQNGQRSY